MPSTASQRTLDPATISTIWSGGLPEPDVWWLLDERDPRQAAQLRRYDYPSSPVRKEARSV